MGDLWGLNLLELPYWAKSIVPGGRSGFDDDQEPQGACREMAVALVKQ